MNYLAHAHLSFGDAALITGNFLADTLRGRQAIEQLPERVRLGITLHRHIDSRTDSHPLVIDGKRRLYERHGKYAAVIVDIYYDHFLAAEWGRFSENQTLHDFAQATYEAYNTHQEWFDNATWQRLEAMMRHNWLVGYAGEEALRYTFLRLSERLKFSNNILSAVDDLFVHYDEYRAEFLAFYPELYAECKSLIYDAGGLGGTSVGG